MSVRADLAGSASGLSAAIATAMGAVWSALTGALLTLASGDWMFCALMICVCLFGLIAALWAARLPVDMS